MKKALTYSIIVGSSACPNNCKICISRMTPDLGLDNINPEKINWRRFQEATAIALSYEARNVLLTGKGEPTMFPGLITQYLYALSGQNFVKRELQTSGFLLAKGGLMDQFLNPWRDMGLNFVALSIYHYDPRKNIELFRPRTKRYYNLPRLIERLKKKDFNVRLSCCLLKGYIDSVEEVEKLIDFALLYDVDQLTLRRADISKEPVDADIAKFTANVRIDFKDPEFDSIISFIEKNGTLNDILPHGAKVFQLYGQNICISTGLTRDAGEDNVRQLIWFPQGWLTKSWEDVQGGREL